MRIIGFLSAGLLTIILWPISLMADFTLVLKNGRRITVQSYREEGGMIKFYGLGGEIGIAKEQIQAILKPGESDRRGLSIRGLAAPPPQVSEAVQPSPEKGPEETKEAPTPEQRLAEEKAKEEKEYQTKLRDITAEIKSLRDQYALTTRGTTSQEPGLLTSEEAIRARTEDLVSRLRDAQHNPAGPSDAGGVTLLTPSPFAGAPPGTTELRPGSIVPRVDIPPPGYSERERELSDLRSRIHRLEKERERLIEEMKLKSLETGSLFLE